MADVNVAAPLTGTWLAFPSGLPAGLAPCVVVVAPDAADVGVVVEPVPMAVVELFAVGAAPMARPRPAVTPAMAIPATPAATAADEPMTTLRRSTSSGRPPRSMSEGSPP